MNNSNSNNVEERRNIELCIGKIGEIYKFLGISKTSTKEEITNKYLKMKNKFGIEENERKRKHLNESLLLAYNILSNAKTRSIYDNYYYEMALSLNDDDDDSGNYLFIYQLLTNPLHVILINITYVVIHTILISNPTNLIISNLFKNNKQKQIIIENISRTITFYPIQFIIECILLSPFIASPIKFLNNIVLRSSNNNNNNIINNNGFQFSNFFYSVGSSILILLFRELIDNSIIKINNLIIEKVNKNNNQSSSYSNFWKYCEMIYCNSFTQGLLRASLFHPLQMIRLQYPYEFIQCSPIPILINPISMAIKIYNQQGFSKFYNGFSISIPFYIIQSISSKWTVTPSSVYLVY
ncbi:hypothetical protein ACTA71_011800 [Dictyostelium dimigraforme]